jgi:competence protein ComEC
VAVATGFDFAVADKPQAWPEYVRRWIMAAARCNEGRLVLWLPVAMAAGIGSYFALPVEPAPFAVGIALILAAVCGYWLIRSGPSAPGLLLMLALTGFLAAKFHTSIASGPSLASPTGDLQISGFVEEIVRGPGRSTKLIVRLESAAGLVASQRPKKLRITAPAQKDLRVGHFVEGQARLFPLLTPVMPGGYDFARAQWLEGIGAGGHARTAFHIRDDRRAPLPLAFKGGVEALRSAIAERVKSALPGRSGVLAVALITGERASLPQEMKDSLQGSGLAHIVSISGLHMSLVAGGFFWVIRALLALSPELSLRRPIKKWSAAAALLAGATYLVLSGGEVPTQRSYIMVAIMFAAIIAGRPALSLRNVALAALCVLLLDPAAVLQPGLQMSFLAVTGLLSFFECWRARENAWLNLGRRSWPVLILRRGGTALMAMAATTIIAGVCTGPPAAYHFNRISPYGLIGNLLALPVVSAVVMPTALAGTLLMPLGLEQAAFSLMGLGLEAVMTISNWTAALPGAQFVVPGHSPASALLMAGGILWVCLMAGQARWCGVAIFLAGLVLAMLAPQPDVLIERTANNIAVRNTTGQLVLASPRRSKFAAQRWLLADGDGSTPKVSAARGGFECSGHVCVASVKSKRVAFADKEAEGKLYCPQADVLIAAFPLRGACKTIDLRIDRFDVWRNGAYALFVNARGIRVETAREGRGQRPWVVRPERRKSDADRDTATKIQ